MNKIKKSFILAIVLVTFLISARKVFSADFENWTFVGGNTSFSDFNFSFHSANFFSHNGGYFLNHTQLSLDYLTGKSVYFGIGYKQEYVKFPTYWRSEYRPMLHLYFEKKFGNFVFRDRSRWEFRIIENELINRYRNQLQFQYENFKKFTPYFSTEFSFYFDEFNYSRQRTIIGGVIPIQSVQLNLFFGHQYNEDILYNWGTKFIMGTSLSYSF